MAKKTTCPISRATFKAKAKPLAVVINGAPMEAPNREFSTGSLGWYLSSKITVEIDGKPVLVQVGLNMTIAGSKELPREAGDTAHSPPHANPPAAAEHNS